MKSTPFVKGNKLSKGRPKGVKNNPDLNSLRKLMEENFHDNRVIIKEMLQSMLMDMRPQVKTINENIVALDLHSDSYLSDYRYYTNMRSNLLEDFKWLMELKERLEPKQIKGDLNITYTAEDLIERFDISRQSSKN